MQYRKVLALLLFSTCEGTKDKYFIEITAKDLKTLLIIDMLDLKLGYSEKATKFEKLFHLKFDATIYLCIVQSTLDVYVLITFYLYSQATVCVTY